MRVKTMAVQNLASHYEKQARHIPNTTDEETCCSKTTSTTVEVRRM
jgi:hypothetical protein